MTTVLHNTDEQLIELLVEHIRNWNLLLEEAFQTEDDETIEAIQQRLREDRQQLNAIRAKQEELSAHDGSWRIGDRI